MQVSILEGPALTSLEHLLQQEDQPNTFDFAFIGEFWTYMCPCECVRVCHTLPELFLHACRRTNIVSYIAQFIHSPQRGMPLINHVRSPACTCRAEVLQEHSKLLQYTGWQKA